MGPHEVGHCSGAFSHARIVSEVAHRLLRRAVALAEPVP